MNIPTLTLGLILCAASLPQPAAAAEKERAPVSEMRKWQEYNWSPKQREAWEKKNKEKIKRWLVEDGVDAEAAAKVKIAPIPISEEETAAPAAPKETVAAPAAPEGTVAPSAPVTKEDIADAAVVAKEEASAAPAAAAKKEDGDAAAPTAMKEGSMASLLKGIAVSTTPVVFPGAPAKPRIRYVHGIKYKGDLKGNKGKKGFFSRFLSWLAGGDKERPLFSSIYDVWASGENIYATDAGGGRLMRLNVQKGQIKYFGESGPGRTVTPVGITVDGEGNIYVSDSADHKVKAFSPSGDSLWIADALPGAGQFNRPAGISLTPDGNLLVADKGNRRLVLLSKEGKFIKTLSSHAARDILALPNPLNLWVDKDGSFLVSDPLASRVHIFTSTGAPISGFGEPGDKPGYLARPRGVAMDSDGNIHVVDGRFHRVQIFNRQGQLLMWYGNPSNGPGGLLLPSGIYIDEDDLIYIADSKNQRIQIFQYISYPDAKASRKTAQE